MAYATTNPFTGKLIKEFPNATDTEVTQAIESAHQAFLSWRTTPFADKAAILSKAAKILRDNKSKYANLLTLEMGKVTAEAEAEVELSAQIFEYYAEHAERLLAPQKLPVADPAEGEAILVNEPLGVLLAIEP